MTRAVRVIRSSLVGVPSTAGWLRPVLLVPASAVTGLTVTQLEAVLAHELAHIRRHDYLVNLVQTGVDTRLFYHPAAWWLSARVRALRAHCCDDLAVAVSGDAVAYAGALARLAHVRQPRTAALLAADGSRLIDRVRRLLVAAEPRQDAGWALPGAVAVALVVLVAGTQAMRVGAPGAAAGAAPAGGGVVAAHLTADGAEQNMRAVGWAAGPGTEADSPGGGNRSAGSVWADVAGGRGVGRHFATRADPITESSSSRPAGRGPAVPGVYRRL